MTQLTNRRIVVVVRRITFGDGVGGLERAAADHIQQMLGAGYDVVLVCPAVIGSFVPPGLHVHQVQWPTWRLPFGLRYVVWCRRVAVALRRLEISDQILHFHGASVGTLRLSRKTSSASWLSVVNPHGMEEFAPRRAWIPRPRPMQWLAKGGRRALAVIATDERMVADVRRNIGVGSDRIVVIPNAIDTSQFGESLSDQSAHATVLTVGRLVESKGYDLLARALSSSEAQNVLPPDWNWVHFGSGPSESTLISLAEELDLPLQIRSGASDAQIRTAYASCDIFVQPSRAEGSSLTTLEAMASGAVAVVTPVGGMPDKVKDGVTGFVADAVTVDGIRDAIVRASQAPPSVRDAARELVRARFDSTVVESRYRDLYEKIARDRI